MEHLSTFKAKQALAGFIEETKTLEKNQSGYFLVDHRDGEVMPVLIDNQDIDRLNGSDYQPDYLFDAEVDSNGKLRVSLIA